MSRIVAPNAVEQVLEGRGSSDVSSMTMAGGGGGRMTRIWLSWVQRVTSVLGGREPRQLPNYTVATLPDADEWKWCDVLVTDASGGEIPCWSDGAVWRRVDDRSEVTI